MAYEVTMTVRRVFLDSEIAPPTDQYILTHIADKPKAFLKNALSTEIDWEWRELD